jgi:hypothetical protein
MKPPKKDVLTAIKNTLKTKPRYTLEDIVIYCAAQGMQTTRKEVMLVIVDMIRNGMQESNVH